MHNHCINKLLNIEDVIVKKVIHADSFVKIHLETKEGRVALWTTNCIG